ncbi:carboxymuconolactone decarboxylase family protein [Jatrophihabitans sp.]|uniref:carboxymuconolactone decarboxylase family protein n=1 Tax=Jatrophihabitans sp. TaxID=1932789 RepID=UPI002B862FBD|nr:carboxymuconolactone decarboxylase family protein [Jatrophihabitans sp.]
MVTALLQKALRRSLDQVRHVSPVRPDGGPDGTVARVYRQAEQDFGMLAPPVALHSPAPGPLAASWMMLRESLLADGLVPRATKEAVAAAVSLGNSCPYCITVHATTLSALLGTPTGAAVSADDLAAIPDPRIRAVAQWARRSASLPDSRSSEVPFSREQAPELIGVAVTFHYLNRMVDIFLADSPLPPNVPGPARSNALRLLGRFMGSAARADHRPGASLDLLPAAPLSEDLAWAAGSPHVAEAFARADAAIEAVGRQYVPASVRAALHARLAGWDGQPPGLSRAWVQDEVASLPPEDRAAGRLVMLTALASYQVDQQVIDAFRWHQPGDEALVAATSWASMAVARQVGCRLRIG